MTTIPRLVDLKVIEDSRGYFFEFYNLNNRASLDGFNLHQVNVSMSHKGVIRGMHYQRGLFSQSKLIICLSGSIMDLCVELKEEIPIKSKIFEFSLSATSNQAILIPKNYAHGFQALEENTIIAYLVDAPYNREAERSFSPLSLFIQNIWPIKEVRLSESDSIARTL